MLKSIKVKDVKVGHIVGRHQFQMKAVEKVEHDSGSIKLHYVDGSSLWALPDYTIWWNDYND